MKVADLSHKELARRMYRDEFFIRFGPFTIALRGDLPRLASQLAGLYGPYPLDTRRSFADFHIQLRRHPLRRWWRPQVQFCMDGQQPFRPFPLDTALPFLEWGLNWCIATRAHQYLMLHAGVVERRGRALILPAWPGSGKSTLCAALIHRGWRLLSDEFALVRADGLLEPMPRLIALKNQSIPVIRRFAPQAVLGPEFPKTRKGTVVHLRPPTASVELAGRPIPPGWIVFPQFKAGAELSLRPLSREYAFLKLCENSFNYERTGLRGFELASRLIEHCQCRVLHYGDLEQVVEALETLIQDDRTDVAEDRLLLPASG